MLESLPPKFSDPHITAKGERRASVELRGLRTLWFNTGTLCNIACENCYIDSSPRNDRLVYLTREEVRGFLAEALHECPELEEIGFTGGEPFMNREFLGMLEDALGTGRRVLVLTNAMRPMQRLAAPFLRLARNDPNLTVRVSLDHYAQERHEQVRGPRSWDAAMAGVRWLARHGFNLSIASRLMWHETEADARQGFRDLFAREGLAVEAGDPARLVLFPEMDESADVPEITDACWGILNKSPDSVMCASSRMVVRHKGAVRPSVIACTLLPYERAFDLGATLAEAAQPVKLNHVHCAKFCVLGGASCSA